MAANKIIPQVYGYLVCIVAVITFLVSTGQLLNAIVDRADPIHADGYYDGGSTLSTFEAYKLEKMNAVQHADSLSRAQIPDNNTLRSMYETEKAEKLAAAKHRNFRSLFVSSVLLVLSFSLFLFHWRWLRSISKQAA
ncbi:MAG: hypothetical protein ACOVP6_06320 [Lacibacter sp.]